MSNELCQPESKIDDLKPVKRRISKIKEPEKVYPFFEITTNPGRVEILFRDLDSRSELNCNENWRVRHARHKKQKRAVTMALITVKDHIALPCKITFVRLAKQFLDKHDNLPSSQKYLLDQTCAELLNDFRPGRADNDDRLSFFYDQEKAKKKGVKIVFEF